MEEAVTESPKPLLTEDQKKVLFVLGMLEELQVAGLVEGGIHRLAEGGRERYRQMVAEGFYLSTEEAMEIIAGLQEPEVHA